MNAMMIAMETLTRVLVLSCLTIVVTSEQVSQTCLQCICEASSGCDLQTKCHNSGANSYFCGPYQISWAYWSDAGKPGNTGQSNDFEVCLNDKKCSEVAVRGYMSKWKRDCNNDGVIDCLDFGAIHKAGASSCDQQWIYNSQYWNVFRQCQGTDSYGPAVKPVQPSQPSEPSQPYPSDPWPQDAPLPQPKPPKPSVPLQPDNSYPQPQDDPWNQPQPSSPAQSQPNRRPVLRPQPQPQPSYRPSAQPQPQPDYDSAAQPQPGYRPQPGPDPWPASPAQPPDDPWNSPSIGQPNPSNSYNPSQPRPSLKPPEQPQPSDPWVETPADQPYSNEPDPWDTISIAIDEVSRPSPKPQIKPLAPQPVSRPSNPSPQSDPWPANPAPQPAFRPSNPAPQSDPWPANPAPQPSSRPSNPAPQSDPWPANPAPQPPSRPSNSGPQPDPWPVNPSAQPIPGRAPSQPVSWAPTERPVNSFGQPFRPVGQPQPDSGHNSQPTETLIEVSAVATNKSLDESCLECICQASSDCDLNKQCEGSYCGPYLLSWAYWSDGGQPGGDYVTCANNKGCAEQTVQGYMDKWQTDCNEDGLIDCTDFAAIHKLGPHSCSSHAIHGTDYWKSYESCKRPTIDARRLPSSEAPVGRSVGPQSGPSANLFQEYPTPSYANPKPVDTRNPVSAHYSRDPRIVFPKDESPTARAQPNGYGGTSPPISPISANNSSNERALDEIGLNRECLDCICHASSRCDPNIGCKNDGSGGYACGLYQMSWAHWSDAGKPAIQGNNENLENFRSCLNNKECSEATLYGYMKKWRRDCNEDRLITCYDLAALHKAGPTNCNAQWLLESQYWSDFRECFDFRRR